MFSSHLSCSISILQSNMNLTYIAMSTNTLFIYWSIIMLYTLWRHQNGLSSIVNTWMSKCDKISALNNVDFLYLCLANVRVEPIVSNVFRPFHHRLNVFISKFVWLKKVIDLHYIKVKNCASFDANYSMWANIRVDTEIVFWREKCPIRIIVKLYHFIY